MTTVQWTKRAQSDLAAIWAFAEGDSPHSLRSLFVACCPLWTGFKTFRYRGALFGIAEERRVQHQVHRDGLFIRRTIPRRVSA